MTQSHTKKAQPVAAESFSTNPDSQRHRLKAALALLGTLFLAALVTVLAKDSLHRIPTFTFVWIQLLFGFITLSTIIAWPFGTQTTETAVPLKQLSGRFWLTVIVVGLLNYALIRYLFIASLELLPVTTHAFLINFTGLVTMIMSFAFTHERPFLIQFIGSLIAISGLAIYFGDLPPPKEMKGIVYLIVLIFALALVNNLIRQLMMSSKPIPGNASIALLSLVFGGVPIIVYGVLTDRQWLALSINDWFVIAANGVVNIALTVLVFNYALRILRSYEASLLASSGVVFTALLAIPLLSEKLLLVEWLGIVVVIAGILLTQFRVPFKKLWFKKS